MTKQAIIFGATGAVGSALLQRCLAGDDYQQISVIARRPAPLSHPKLTWIETDLATLADRAAITSLSGGDAFCCLGTTLKAAGSQQQFRRVDVDFVCFAAAYSQRCAINSFNLVSAVGADSEAKAFYNRAKGDSEAAVLAQGLPVLRIFRPSLLQGKRQPFRFAESVGNAMLMLLRPLFWFGLQRYQPLAIDKLANALYCAANTPEQPDKLTIYESEMLQHY
jgi:uncharacterized protein YbjT (DUF2867 family)